MENEVICGIYKITSPTGKVYIGESKNILKRWKDYKRLRCKTQIKIYNSFMKHGVENHTFEIIERCEFDELKCRERYWQDFYNVLDKGLNLKLTECAELKVELSEETIEKIKTNCFRFDKGINNPFSKICYQYDLEGNFIKKWDCIMDIERDLGFDNSLVTRCLKGNTRTCFNNQWFYEYKGDKIDSVKVGTQFMGTRNPETLLDMKKLWEEDSRLTMEEVSIILGCKLSTIRNLWHKHKEFISGSSQHRRKNNPSEAHLKSIKKAQETLKQKKMKTKKFYRVCHEDTKQGLWYCPGGTFTGLIHDKFKFCKNSDLEMHFDAELTGWLSATESLEDLMNWFSEEDIKELQKHGWFIYEYAVKDYKFYDRFKHYIINQETSVPLNKIEL